MVLHQEEGLVLLAGGVQQHGHEEDVLKQRGGLGPVVKPRNTDLEREVNTIMLGGIMLMLIVVVIFVIM